MVARTTEDALDLGWSDPPLSDTVESSAQSAAPLANADAAQSAAPLDNSDDDEPTRVATSVAAIVAAAAPAAIDVPSELPLESAALDVSAAVTEALDASDIPEEGARVTEPGLAPPPPTSAEIAAAEALVAVRETPAAPPIMNPPPVELGRAELTAAARTEGRSPAAVSASPTAQPAASSPPPHVPALVTPASLAPTAVDWDELASPSLLATMKRTRPTSAWTGVGLFVAALTFAGGIGIGRSMNPPMLPPVAVPAPVPASVAAGSLSPTSTPAATTAPAAPVPSSKPTAPFDAKAARVALDDAANAAKTCRATGDPKGTIPATVTFDPSGQVANVAIKSSRYAGTKTARCISERLSQTRVSEFSGFPESLKAFVTVR